MVDSIDRHRSVDYAAYPVDEVVAGFVVTPALDGRGYHVVGQCPRCGGRTTASWNVGTGNGYKGMFSPETAPLRDKRRTVFCECGHAHADRPENAVFFGCGAYWWVELP